MKQNFYFNEVGSLAIISIISLASFLAFHAVDAAGAIQTINGNNSTNQSITSQAVGNITVTSSSGVTTIGLGWHVLMDNGQNQTLTKGIDVLSNSTVAPLLSSTYSSNHNASIGAIVARTAFENRLNHPVAAQSGQYLGKFEGLGFTGSAWETSGAGLWIAASQTHTATAQGAGVYIRSTANGQTTPTNNFNVGQDGTVGITSGKSFCLDRLNSTTGNSQTCKNYFAYSSASGTQWFGGGINMLTVDGTNKITSLTGNVSSTATTGTFKITTSGAAICIGAC